MPLINGTPGDDTISPAFLSPGVVGAFDTNGGENTVAGGAATT